MLPVIYEDNHLLVVAKPAGLATMGTQSDRPSAWQIAKQYLAQKYAKPGNVYLGVVSRLDAPATGVLPFARTSKAAARLSDQFKRKTVGKIYWAIVGGRLPAPAGQWEDWLLKDEQAQRMVRVAERTPGAQLATLQYRSLGPVAGGTWVEVRLLTGRKHQIRVQFAERGCPIFGDRKYGSRQAFEPGIALHARQITLEHPTRKTPLVLEAPLPKVWRNLGVRE